MTDALNVLRDALADRYEFQRELGHGGMAVVHLAHDRKLQRPVAVKVLRSELANPVLAQRFLREIQIAAQLQHPHILALFDSGEVNGMLYYVMPYVEGESLRDRMKRETQLDLDDALEIACEVASALAYAHGRGVVHRDIKPENILLSERHAMVADFGIARALGKATAASPGEPLTFTGFAMGTPAYMSPEQLLAVGEIDGRADIYSLGCVLFEMLAGRLPFDRPGAVALRLADALPRLCRLRPDVPAAVEHAVGRALVADPDRRFASAREFAEALTAREPTAARPPSRAGRADAQTGAAPVAASTRASGGPSTSGGTSVRVIVGRESEHAQLRAAYELASRERGLLVAVAGEPGIGKTAFVENFLVELVAGEQPPCISRGRCSERLAGAEAYLPILELLEDLLRVDTGVSLEGLMRLAAPSWHAQVAPRSGDGGQAGRQPSPMPPSQERMKRELSLFLEEASRVCPVVLFIDDIHWADVSTVDMLTYLAAKFDAMRVLVVTTHRQSELLLGKHAFAAMKLDLQARGLCREIALPFLTREDTERYLALRFPDHGFPAEFPALVHARTEGSPLFMVDLIHYLHGQGMLGAEHGRKALTRPVMDIGRDVPESVRSMIQRKIEQLSDAHRRLLSVASVQGNEFDSAVVARVLTLDAADVEEALDVLERLYAFVRRVGEHELPDRTLSIRYRFVHVLYQNSLYASLSPSRRASLSTGVARALLEFHGEQSGAIAVQLAILFEAARDADNASAYFLRAARNALKVFANQEAITLVERGLAQLAMLPDSPERAQRELALNLALGFPLMAVKGYGAPETERAFNRAYELSQQLGEHTSLFPALWGLWGSTLVAGDVARNSGIAEQLFRLAERSGDRALLVQAHLAVGMTKSVFAVELVPALEHFDRAIALYQPEEHRSHTVRYGHDPAVVCLSQSLSVLWLLGRPEQALERSRRLLAVAESVSHPASAAFARLFCGLLHMLRREPDAARDHAEATIAIASEHNLVNWLGWGTFVKGWALAMQGQPAEGIAQVRHGRAIHEKISGYVLPQFLLMEAEAMRAGGQIEDALATVAEGIETTERDHRTGNRAFGAELYRLRGELLMERGAPRAETDASLLRALELASEGSLALELRAAMSLSRTPARGMTRSDALDGLARVYGRFTEGFDTRDLREATQILAEAGRCSPADAEPRALPDGRDPAPIQANGSPRAG